MLDTSTAHYPCFRNLIENKDKNQTKGSGILFSLYFSHLNYCSYLFTGSKEPNCSKANCGIMRTSRGSINKTT